jgi:hypothetical protein
MYQTVTLGNVIARILRLRGFDPTTFLPLMTVKEQQQYADAINSSLKDIWTDKFWTDLMRWEQRTYRPPWNAGQNYAAGQEVFREDVSVTPALQDYYYAVTTNSGQDPLLDTAGTYWKKVEYHTFPKYIEFFQPWESVAMDAVQYPMCATKEDPRFHTAVRWIEDVAPLFNGQGLLFPARTETFKPWIRFRPLPPEFSMAAWSAGTNYETQSMVYVDPDCWMALVPNSGVTPGTDPTTWQKVGVPKMFDDYVVLSSVGILIRENMGNYKDIPAIVAERNRLYSRYIDRVGLQGQAVWRSGSRQIMGRGYGR